MASNIKLSAEANDISYIARTTVSTEMMHVDWTMEHFSAMVQQRLPDVSLTFDAGGSFGVPYTLYINLEYYPSSGVVDHVRFVMSCINKNRPDDKIYARCEVSVTHGTRHVIDNRSRSVQEAKKLVSNWMKFYPQEMGSDNAFIQLRLVIFGNKATLASNQADINEILKDESHQKITDDMQRLLDSGYNSDFVIKVPSDCVPNDYESFNVHKNILTARSEVFKAMLETPMLETQSGEVTFEDLSPAGLKIFLKFLYTGIVDENWKNNAKEVVDVANRFSLPTLKNFVDMNLHLICNVTNATDLLQLAKIYGLTRAFKSVLKYIQSNLHDIAKDS